MYIFKYQDTFDLNYAFIISDDEPKARKILSELTDFEIVLKRTVNLSDFPHIEEFWNETKSPVYINKILPF